MIIRIGIFTGCATSTKLLSNFAPHKERKNLKNIFLQIFPQFARVDDFELQMYSIINQKLALTLALHTHTFLMERRQGKNKEGCNFENFPFRSKKPKINQMKLKKSNEKKKIRANSWKL